MLFELDVRLLHGDNKRMETPRTSHVPQSASIGSPLIPSDNRVAIDQACVRMDRQREELKQKLGEVEIAVEIMREVRE